MRNYSCIALKKITSSKTASDELIVQVYNVASTSKEAQRVNIKVLESSVIDQSKVMKSKGGQKAELITSTPYKDEI